MPHNNRPFDRQSYNQNDARAKKAMVSYLTAQNFSNIVDKEDYYFDVLTLTVHKLGLLKIV